MRIERIDITHACGYPLTIRIRTRPPHVQFFLRDTTAVLAACPNCKQPMPQISIDELLEQLVREP